MNKYGVLNDARPQECEECGDTLTRVDGKLVCLSCEQERTYGLETSKKAAKQPPVKWS